MKIDLDASKKYLLACSFGPDSMALFSLLKEQGYTFEVAHVNYNMRSESLDEMTKLNEYCKENGNEFFRLGSPALFTITCNEHAQTQ